MKKILFLLAFVFLSVISYSQSKFIRTFDLTIGLKNDGKVEWSPSSKVSVLIKLDTYVIVIYSNINQTFRVISYDGKYDNGIRRWYCSDSRGLNCYLYITTIDPKTGVISVGVEYDDLTYYYRGYQE